MAAVSARSTSGPSDTKRTKAQPAKACSSGSVKPPSGPTSRLAGTERTGLSERSASSSGAASGMEAFYLAIQVRFDVVLLDLSMPDLDGIEVARMFRLELPRDSATSRRVGILGTTAGTLPDDSDLPPGAGMDASRRMNVSAISWAIDRSLVRLEKASWLKKNRSIFSPLFISMSLSASAPGSRARALISR